MGYVSFFGTIDKWALGEPPRIEIVSRPNDNATAQSLALLKQRELSLTIYEGAKDDEFCVLTAVLPLIQSSVAKAGKGTRVKLDIDPRQTQILMRVLAISDRALRFAVADKGEKPGKAVKESKSKETSPFGAFWHELDARGFHNRTDVRAWTGYDGRDENEARDAIRGVFGVERRSYQLSPELLIETMDAAGGLAGAIEMVKTARRKVGL